MNRTCNACNESKSASEYYSGSAICKSCKIKKVVARKKPTPAETRRHDVKTMIEHLQKLQSILLEDQSDVRDQCERMETGLKEALRLNKLAYDGIVLSIQLKIPEDLHNFLVKLGEDDKRFAPVKTARMYLSDANFERGFEQHFGVKRSSLLVHCEFLKDLETLVGFVGAAYYALSDGFLAEKNSSFVNPDDHISDHELRSQIAIQFEPNTDSIVAEGNPLRIDREMFLAGLDELIEQGHYNILGFVSAGYLAKLKSLIL